MPRFLSSHWTLGRHLAAVAGLCAIIVFPRIFAAAQAVAPARDAFRYWSASACLDEFPFWRAVQWIDCQPLYPLTLAWIPGTGFSGDPETGWRVSQAWSVICYVWFVVVSYIAGLRLFPPAISWLGCVLASLLPRQIRYSIDVLADNLHAALWMTVMALLVWSWPSKTKSSAGPVLLAGIVTGFAWWTRFEAILLPAAFLAAMVLRQFFGDDRLGMPAWLFRVAAYTLPVAVAIVWYVDLRGGVSSRPTVQSLVWSESRGERVAGAGGALSRLDATHVAPALEAPRTPIDAWLAELGAERTTIGLVGSFGRVAWEYLQETRGWVGLLAVVGIVFAGRTARSGGAMLLITCVLVCCAGMTTLVRWKVGFLAGRYMMPLMPLVGMFAAVAILHVWARLDAGVALDGDGQGQANGRRVRPAAAWIAAVVLVGVAANAPAWIEPLHKDRQGHRAAARWIEQHLAPGEQIFDPSWVCGYFAHRPLWHPVIFPTPDCRYAVIEPVVAARPPAHLAAAMEFVARHGRVVAEFRQRPGRERIGVRVVELSPPAMATAAATANGSRSR